MQEIHIKVLHKEIVSSLYVKPIKEIHKLPLLKVTIEDSAGETLSADSNAFQHTITPQLVNNQEVLHQT